MTTQIPANAPRHRRAKQDQRDFNVIFALTFTLFFIAAIGQRLLPGYWMDAQKNDDIRQSIIGQALASARTVVPYAFMG